ncbi:MAG: ABC transporter ATP-binding protein [Candidatus Bathyarchaeota archaeon]|nr:ABC transporter ATP-binding protein [Candidatus Bathyarchaeota archaeon]
MGSFLKVSRIWKYYSGKPILKDVSFEVGRGEYFVVLGPTGAGKTTLLKIVAGIVDPDEGEISIGGRPVVGIPPEERGVGYFPQFFNLFNHMTVWDNVYFPLLVKGVDTIEAEKICREMLNLMHLLDRADSYPYELSGGMRQRVALARALATEAELLLLDEPLSQLDAKLSVELRGELKSIAKNLNRTVVHVTNNVEEAIELADRIAVMNDGCIIQIGSYDELRRNPRNLFVAYFISDVNIFRAYVSDPYRGLLESSADTCFKFKIEASYGDVSNVLKSGNEVIVCIDMEDVRIDPPVEPGWNTFDALVEEVLFHRGRYIYVLRVCNGAFKIMAKSMDESGIEAGCKVKAGFRASDVRIYKASEYDYIPYREG